MSQKKQSVKDRAMIAISSRVPSSTESVSQSQPHAEASVEPKTGPGTTMRFMQTQAAQDVVALNARVKELELSNREMGNSPRVEELDPNLIDDSKWANRHADSFRAAEFVQLKEEIRSAGQNVQPIKVRVHPTKPGRYEVVFGHRRLRACRELGLKVKAMVVTQGDQELFIDMDRENRSRADLRPFEQGAMYLKAIKGGLFKNKAELAKATGANEGLVSQAVKIAELPAKVLSAFKSPLDIQYRWAKPLGDMVEKHPQRLEANLIKLSTADTVANLVADDEGELANKQLTPAETFAILTDLKDHVEPASREVILSTTGSVVAELSRKGGRLTIAFNKSLKFDDNAVDRIKHVLEKLHFG